MNDIPVFDDKNNLHWINKQDVICIYSHQRKIVVQTMDGYYYKPRTIKQWAKVYEPDGYYRIDGSHIINVSKVKDFDEGYYSIVKIDGETLQVSRDRKKGLKKRLK